MVLWNPYCLFKGLHPASENMELSVANIVLVAKQHEIEELRHLASKAQLVGVIGHLVHALQNERGASSIFLASGGQRFEATRRELIDDALAVESYLRASFEAQLENASFGNAKLLSLMAWVLLGLDALPDLRRQISEQKMSAHEAVTAISRLIAGLVSLIFEVADAAIDPDISRLLVALFNFVQGKELAGQERAIGALSFASGCCDGPHQQRVLHLIDAQESNFQIFSEFAEPAVLEQWQAGQEAPYVVHVERLRRILCSAKPGAALDANLSDKWFAACSDRLSGMWQVQCTLVDLLQQRCAALIAEAERNLLDSEGLLKVLRDNPPPSAGLIDRYFDPEIPVDQALRFLPGDSATARVGQSLINVLQAQSERLASTEAELASARRALNERKLIERAKGMLMARFNLSEEDAYKTLRTASMEQNRRLVDVAEATLSLPGFLSPSGALHQS